MTAAIDSAGERVGIVAFDGALDDAVGFGGAAALREDVGEEGCAGLGVDAAVGGIRGLFPKNERLITFLQTEYGKIAVVKVGASNVGKIRVTYDNKIVTNKLIRFPKEHEYPNVNIMIDKGSELGRFEMGSTVILVFENDTIDLNPFVKDERSTYGSTVGLFKRKIMNLPK